MTSDWYSRVPGETPITQGDIVLSCPVVAWKGEQSKPLEIRAKTLGAMIAVKNADVIVLSQVCDLAQNKVSEALVCQHYSLPRFRVAWEVKMKNEGNNPTDRAWKSNLGDICDSFAWQHFLLAAGSVDGLETEYRIVDFYKIYTLPVTFLNSFVSERKKDRLVLNPPYREHLSQAFARFFMRVGLPSNIDKGHLREAPSKIDSAGEGLIIKNTE